MNKKDFVEIMRKSGEEGKHITDFLIELEMTYEEHYQMLKKSKKYRDAFSDYQKLAENYWYNLALYSMSKDGAMRFNARLWSLVMRNKFGENWTDSTKVDLTSAGEKITNPEPIKIEIIRKKLEE